MECGFVETTDRGLQCEFNNIFTFESSEVAITESNRLIDAVSFRQSELISVPADLFVKFPQLKHLDVELTSMKLLEADNFRGANELKYFLARFNDIEELKSGVFVSCPQLKFIVMQHNQISRVDREAFRGLTNLEALYLDYNRLATLPGQLLEPCTSLLHFSLAYNNLTLLPDDFFSRNEKLETFNLGHNLLSSFNETQFDSLPNLELVQLDHNQLKRLDLAACKSTEINVDKNQLEALELNKWTRFVSGWGNPVKSFTLHEHYGTGRTYNFSFSQVNQITFFVNEFCCTVENLENFSILTQSFGDLAQKRLDVNDWKCQFLKSVGYETPQGLVVNNVCKKLSDDRNLHVSEEEEATTELSRPTFSRSSTQATLTRIRNQEDLIESEEVTTSTKPRESMEDTSLPPSIFVGLNIETIDPFTAKVEEVFPTTEDPYEEKCEKGIYKTVKTKVIGWKDKAVKKWNDWLG